MLKNTPFNPGYKITNLIEVHYMQLCVTIMYNLLVILANPYFENNMAV